jgi:hypothetical protein
MSHYQKSSQIISHFAKPFLDKSSKILIHLAQFQVYDPISVLFLLILSLFIANLSHHTMEI